MMARRKPATSIEAQARDETRTMIEDMVTAIAAEHGPAEGAEHVTPDRELDLWGQMDPRVDWETLRQQLMQGAVDPSMIDPENPKGYAAVKQDPEEWAKYFEAPLDEETADHVATWMEYPARRHVLEPLADDPIAYIKKSNSLTDRWLRRMGTATADEPLPSALEEPVDVPVETPQALMPPPTPEVATTAPAMPPQPPGMPPTGQPPMAGGGY